MRRFVGFRGILGLGVVALAVVGSWWLWAEARSTPRDLPPFGIQFSFDQSRAYQPTEAIPAQGYARRLDPQAAPPAMLPGLQGWRHWLTLTVIDPDDLTYRWEREFRTEEAYREELARWSKSPTDHHFSLDLRDWAPAGFPWKSGLYRISGQAQVGNEVVPASGSAVFLKEVPAKFRKPLPEGAAVDSGVATLQLALKANQQTFKRGDLVVLEGTVKNIGQQPYMLQTRLPFLEARLRSAPGGDVFPGSRPQINLRLSDFSRLDPGETRLLFRETFVAGRPDPDWQGGHRREYFPPPFGANLQREIWLELASPGLFPNDRQPDVGIWRGRAESNRVTISVP